MARHMITTTDNPHSPFTDYDKWYQFDLEAGHDSTSLLARVVVTTDELSEADQDFAIESAIDEIVKEDPMLIYRKVTRK